MPEVGNTVVGCAHCALGILKPVADSYGWRCSFCEWTGRLWRVGDRWVQQP
jgi:hypothetical protein